MIVLKTSKELALMREAGRISHLALMAGVKAVAPGKTTMEINQVIHDFIVSHGAKPSFLGYGGFPAAACISINEEVIHGIPSKHRKIKEGDILAIENGKVTSVESDIVKAAVKLTKSMVKKQKGEAGFVTIIYGEDATEEQAAQVEQEIKEKVDPDLETAIVNGGTPIYYFTISVE